MKTKDAIKRMVQTAACALFLACIPQAALNLSAADGSGVTMAEARLIKTGDVIYFGNTKGEAIPWNVLSTEGNQADALTGTGGPAEAADAYFLFSQYVLSDNLKYKAEYDLFDYAWAGSDVQNWCRDFAKGSFSAPEYSAILKTSKTDPKAKDMDGWTSVGYWMNNELVEDQLFFLSKYELDEYVPGKEGKDYIASDIDGTPRRWWIRTTTDNFDDGIINAGYVDEQGEGYDYSVDGAAANAARPAMNLDIRQAFLAIPADQAAPEVSSTITALEEPETDAWKLALKDEGRDRLTCKTVGVSEDGKTLEINYSGAEAGANEYIAAAVKNSEGKITHFALVAKADATSGTVELHLGSTDFTDSTLNILSYQSNGPRKTDYAGKMVPVSLTVSKDEEQESEEGKDTKDQISDGSKETNNQKTTIKCKTTFTVKGYSYKVVSAKAGTIALIKAKNIRTVTVPASVKYKNRNYKVVSIEKKAFTGRKIRKVTIGKNVKTIKAKAFQSSKATTVTLKTKGLTKKSVKKSLQGSKVKTMKVKIGSKKVNKTYVKKYSKIFTKKIAGRKVTVK